MICSKCNHEYPDDQAICPICGEPRPSDTASGTPGGGYGTGADSGYSSQSASGTGTYMQTSASTSQWQRNTTPPPAPPLPSGQEGKSGTTPLVLGILSLFLPYIGIVLGILAIVFGSGAKKTNLKGSADYALGHAGWILGIIGLCFQAFLVIWMVAIFGMIGTMMNQITDYLPYGYNYDFDSFFSAMPL